MAKGKEWAFLRGRLPELGPDPKYTDVIDALRKRYAASHINDVVRAWNQHTERKAKLTQRLKEVNADLVALEHLVREHLERNNHDSIECEGVTLSKSPEVNVKVVDKDAFMAFMAEHYPEMISYHTTVPKTLAKAALRAPTPGHDPAPMPEGIEVSLFEAVKRRESAGYVPPAFDDNEDDQEAA